MDSFEAQFRQFILFHFSPTLIYRNAYPRSRKALTLPPLTSPLLLFCLFAVCASLLTRCAVLCCAALCCNGGGGGGCAQIRWSYVVLCLLEVVGCIFYTYVIFVSFCVPEFQKTAFAAGDTRALILSIFNSMIPSIVVYLLAFFGYAVLL
jgi:hypothetical protein